MSGSGLTAVPPRCLHVVPVAWACWGMTGRFVLFVVFPRSAVVVASPLLRDIRGAGFFGSSEGNHEGHEEHEGSRIRRPPQLLPDSFKLFPIAWACWGMTGCFVCFVLFVVFPRSAVVVTSPLLRGIRGAGFLGSSEGNHEGHEEREERRIRRPPQLLPDSFKLFPIAWACWGMTGRFVCFVLFVVFPRSAVVVTSPLLRGIRGAGFFGSSEGNHEGHEEREERRIRRPPQFLPDVCMWSRSHGRVGE